MKRALFGLMVVFLLVPSTKAELNVYDSEGKKYVLSTLELLELPQTTITTKIPWNPEASEYSGITMNTLLKFLDISINKQVTFVALNDYKISIPKEDFLEYQPIIAIKENRKLMSIRKKGPYWLIYPLSTHPEINNTDFHAKMIWQIKDVYF
ncbi:putative pterin-binding protein [Vibrio campbellii]|uniref:hypothetical protein n=1 Tax=Vibrio campbellii TaxID=680 RepID=UPI001E654852|nr:hypothetical protein [Vibrio campbellii]MCC8256582.1 hypothetical protein [Vibrio campbellii CAIM 333]